MHSHPIYNSRQFKQAVEWFVRLQSEQSSHEDRQLFETWLNKHQSHPTAYAEAERVWANMDDLKFIPIPALAEARTAKPNKSSASRLASLVLFIAATGAAWLEYSAETVQYATQVGEHRRIDLADNSHIDLNTNSQISVRISLLNRHVQLSQGEALFEVSHNRLRPFTVAVGELQIRDIGTRFNVRKQPQGTTVSVLEGEVELSNGNSVIDKHLIAGNQLSYSESSGLGQLQTAEANQITAWVNGQLIFKRTPLSEVAAELERYHAVQFSFTDSKLAQETLSGTFDAADIDPFLHALETILPVQAKRNGQQILLRRMHKKN
jgi:transmembrane sensor